MLSSSRSISLFLALALALLLFSTATAQATVDWQVKNRYRLPDKPLDIAASLDGRWLYVLGEGGKLHVLSTTGKPAELIQIDDPTVDRLALSGLGLAGIQDKVYVASSANHSVQEITIDFSVTIDTKGAPFLGNPKAPVEIVEFSDFECPYCSRVPSLLEEVLANNPDQVKIVFKQFPLSFHKNARRAALAALAAARQGKFWQFHDRLFENQQQLSPPKIRAIAQQLGLDMKRFEKDLADPALQQRLEQDIDDGRRAGVRGTPTIFINGRRLKKRNLETIQKMIDQELARRKPPTS